MIYTERKVSIKNDKATIDSPIILFRGDREVEIMFTIIDSKFKFESNKGNVIDKTQAAFGQLAVALPDGTDLFTEIVKCENGVVVFSITGEMIDEIHEVGFYSFHIRLYNDDKTSRITLPPVMEGIEIREPLIIEGDVENTDLVGDATVGYAMVKTGGAKEEVFDENGNYIRNVWGIGDKITAQKLNKIEAGLADMSGDILLNDVIVAETDTLLKTDAYDNTSLDNPAGIEPYGQKNFITSQCTINTVKIGVKYIAVGTGQIRLYILDNNMNKLLDKLVDVAVREYDVLKGKGIVNINIGDYNLEPGHKLVVHNLANTNIAILYDNNAVGVIEIFTDDISSVMSEAPGQIPISVSYSINMKAKEYMDNLYVKKDDVDVNDVDINTMKANVPSSYTASGSGFQGISNDIFSNHTVYPTDINITRFTGSFTINEPGTYPINFYAISNEGKAISSSTYNIECAEVGIMDMYINDMNMTLPAGCYLAMQTTHENLRLNFHTYSVGTDVYLWQNNGDTFTHDETIRTTSLTYKIEYTVCRPVEDLILADYSRLIYKKVIAIGDSMVQGSHISRDEGWLAMIAKRNRMEYVNYGINGNFLTNRLNDEHKGVVESFQDMDDDADYIIVFAGTNDAQISITIGNDDSTDPSEFKGALNIICDGLLTKYPTKHVMFITPYLKDNSFIPYIEAIETICAKYSIPVFNNAKNGGICWTNQAQVNRLTAGDKLHLNLAGMEYASYKYEAFLKNL